MLNDSRKNNKMIINKKRPRPTNYAEDRESVSDKLPKPFPVSQFNYVKISF